MTKKSNCVIYALTEWLKRKPPGHESYLVIRRSRIRWGFIHVLHGKLDLTTNQIEVDSYKPNRAYKTGFAPTFEGSVQYGDKPMDKPAE